MAFSLLKRLPVIGKVVKSISASSAKANDNSAIQQIAGSRMPQASSIAAAIKAISDGGDESFESDINAVEKERQRLLADESPLIDGTLGDADEHDVGRDIRRVCKASKPPKAGRLLYNLARNLTPSSILELGTNVGLSSSFLGMGIERAESEGSIFTFDLSPYRQRVAQDVHSRLGLTSITCVQGYFDKTLAQSLGQMPPIDMAFVDGHHEFQPTLDYTELILAASSTNAIFVYDDIRWSDGMRKAWKQLCKDSRFGWVIDLQTVGICIRDESSSDLPRLFPRIRRILSEST